MGIETTRRQVLQGMGLAAVGGIVAASVPGLIQSASAATNAGAKTPVFGINDLDWGVVSAALGGGVRGKRLSSFGPNGVPRNWPRVESSVRLVVDSFNPDIAKVLSGELDEQIVKFAAKIPAGQTVSVWHEGERENLGHTAKEITGVQERCYRLLKQGSPKCRVVQIITCYSLISRKSSFGSFLAPMVDGIYLDGYQRDSSITVSGMIGKCADAVRSVVGHKMPLGLAETNSWVPSLRPAWFKDAWSLAKDEGYEVFFPFFAQAGNPGRVVNWAPHDTSTIRELRSIAGT